MGKTRNYSKGQRKNIFYDLTKLKGCYGKCFYCGIDLQDKDGKYEFHIDHIEPISKGGSDDMDNLAIVCKMCNGAKGTMSLGEYREWLYHVYENVPDLFVRSLI